MWSTLWRPPSSIAPWSISNANMITDCRCFCFWWVSVSTQTGLWPRSPTVYSRQWWSDLCTHEPVTGLPLSFLRLILVIALQTGTVPVIRSLHWTSCIQLPTRNPQGQNVPLLSNISCPLTGAIVPRPSAFFTWRVMADRWADPDKRHTMLELAYLNIKEDWPAGLSKGLCCLTALLVFYVIKKNHTLIEYF